MQKTILLVLLFLGMTTLSICQICNGNLGENIFPQGDFGSGEANILVPNPQIAPGYGYTTNPPPTDGNYTITNNTTNWGSFAGPNWADIGDNSSDPNGYMMVVNASYEPGLFYEQEVEGLCENTLYVFSVDVFNFDLDADGIRPNVSFLLGGVEVYATGDVPANVQWHTYGFTFTTEPQQTSVTLALRNNAPGGNGNDLALDNVSFRACGPQALILPETITNICEDGNPISLEATIIGDQYNTPQIQWQQSFDEGLTWVDIPNANGFSIEHTALTAGFYYYRYLLANDPNHLLNPNCRVLSNVKIIHVVPKYYMITDTLCEGLTFSLGDEFYTQTGIYQDSFISSIGCDSILTLDLTFVPDNGIDAQFDLLDPSCDYLQDGSIEINEISNGTAPFSIFINGEINEQNGSIFNIGAGDYHYHITDQYGCSFETTLQLQNPPTFTLNLGEDFTIELGEEVTLSPSSSLPISTYSWEPADLVNCSSNCEELTFFPLNSMIYYLTASSDIGCIALDSIRIDVTKVRPLYIPNAFSPNQDGFNDYFTIYGQQPNIQAIQQLVILDRWGNVVFDHQEFEPNTSNQAWDGSVDGKELPTGIYTYLAKIRFLDGAIIHYAGDILLIR